MSTVKQIRPSLGFNTYNDADLLTRSTAIQAAMTGNDAYPNPPVDPETFKTAIGNYGAAITAALDGSKKAKAERQKHRAEILFMLRQLGHYVEAACDGDMTVFLSSGFGAASFARAAPQPPAQQPKIQRLEQGNSGQLLVRIKAVRDARTYELRHAALDSNGAPTGWTTTIVVNVRSVVPVDHLTPGTIYSFQVRAINGAGVTDWSDAVDRMVI